jgi:hypothetical protein
MGNELTTRRPHAGIALLVLAGLMMVASPAGAADEEPEEERLGEASLELESRVGEACRAACAANWTALCVRVGLVCLTAATVTFAGAVIPCTPALYAACAGGAGGLSLCTGSCPP